MKQVIIRQGKVTVEDVPAPAVEPFRDRRREAGMVDLRPGVLDERHDRAVNKGFDGQRD
jgi:hypothetical protein